MKSNSESPSLPLFCMVKPELEVSIVHLHRQKHVAMTLSFPISPFIVWDMMMRKHPHQKIYQISSAWKVVVFLKADQF